MQKICEFCKNILELLSVGTQKTCKACGLVVSKVDFSNSDASLIATGYITETFRYDTVNSSTKMKRSGGAKDRQRVQSLGNWHTRMRSASVKDKNVMVANNELDKLLGPLGASTYLKATVFDLFKELLEKGITKGRSIATIICALSYMVAMRQRIPISFDTFVNTVELKKKRVSKMYKFLLKALPQFVITQDPTLFLTKYAHCLQLAAVETQLVLTRAQQLAPFLQLLSKAGKGPSAFAATLIWCTAKISQINFSERRFTQQSKLTLITVSTKAKMILSTLLAAHNLPTWVSKVRISSLLNSYR